MCGESQAATGPLWGSSVTLMEIASVEGPPRGKVEGSLKEEAGRQGGRKAGGTSQPLLSPILVLGPASHPPAHSTLHQAVTRPTLPDPHLSHPQPPKCLEPPSHPEEPSDLEELEQFARTFKQRRIKLGFTQVRFGASPQDGRWA